MPVVSRATLKSYFENGKEPDENKYIDLVDTLALISEIISDHGGLSGLGDDDHSIYFLVSGARALLGNLVASGGIVAGNSSGTPDPDAIRLYYGGTLMGELKVQDTTWFRLNQNVSKNIYTPQSIGVAGSITAGTSTIGSAGEIRHTDNLRPYRNSTWYTAYSYVPLTTYVRPINLTGQSGGTTSRTLTGIPANVKAINCRLFFVDNASSDVSFYGSIGPSSGSPYNVIARNLAGAANANEQCGICSTTGTNSVYLKLYGSASNMDVLVDVYGYWI